jgi:hypothetical protein
MRRAIAARAIFPTMINEIAESPLPNTFPVAAVRSSWRLRPSGAALGLLLACLAGPLAWAADAPATAPAVAPADFSAAEVRLFMSDHFKALPARPAVLAYHFAKSGAFEAGYDDKVTIELGSPDAKQENARSAKVEFLSGAHKVELPPLDAVKGNPAILGFLERDIREMSRITGGGGTGGAYYKKRLRMAMVETRESKPVTIKWGGKELKADEFVVDPYKDDPARARYARFANKIYTFVMCDQVPGEVYSIRSVMREGSGTNGKTMIDESLTLTESK